MFSTFEIYSDRIQNRGHSFSVLPVHQVGTVGKRKGAYKQTMKALTIFNDYISLKQAIGYMCTTKSEQYAKLSGGKAPNY